MPKNRKPAGRNPVARALSNPLFKSKVVKAKKGRASYKRRPKHVKPYADGVFFRSRCSLIAFRASPLGATQAALALAR